MRVLLIRSLYIQAVVLVVPSIPNYRPNVYMYGVWLSVGEARSLLLLFIILINSTLFIPTRKHLRIHTFFPTGENEWRSSSFEHVYRIRNLELLFTNFYLLSIVGNKGSRAAEDSIFSFFFSKKKARDESVASTMPPRFDICPLGNMAIRRYSWKWYFAGKVVQFV